MQSLEVSVALRPLQETLGFKGLKDGEGINSAENRGCEPRIPSRDANG
jgi:hypothetical protein